MKAPKGSKNEPKGTYSVSDTDRAWAQDSLTPRTRLSPLFPLDLAQGPI